MYYEIHSMYDERGREEGRDRGEREQKERETGQKQSDSLAYHNKVSTIKVNRVYLIAFKIYQPK